MQKSVLIFTLLCLFGVSFAIDAQVLSSLVGGFSEIDEKGLDKAAAVVPTAFNLLYPKYPEFNYVLKRVVSGKSQPVAGSRTILKVELTHGVLQPEVKKCDLDFVEDLKSEITKVEVKCENDSLTYTYEKPSE